MRNLCHLQAEIHGVRFNTLHTMWLCSAWSTYGRWYLKTQHRYLIMALFTDSCRRPGWANLGGGACLGRRVC